MKGKYFLYNGLLFCTLFISPLYGQIIQLTFTATNNGLNVPLDSIRVMNLTQGGDTLLIWPDSILVLGSVGIPEPFVTGTGGFSMTLSVNSSLPDQSNINIFVPDEGKVTICYSDILGRNKVLYDERLCTGNHRFHFNPGSEKISFLSASWRGCVVTAKIAAFQGKTGAKSGFTYIGISDAYATQKNKKALNSIIFIPGDQLRMIGYASTIAGIQGSDVLDDTPVANATYQFAVIEGIPCQGIPAFTYDGLTYNTVQIGTQCWMKENLNIGTMIIDTHNSSNDSIIEKYCHDNDPAYCATYGGLYQWDEAMQYCTTPGAQGICPAGWHIPTDAEYCTLVTFLDPSVNCSTIGLTGTNAGGKMRETGTVHWISPNVGATNESGFTGYGAGHRGINGNFGTPRIAGSFWTSTIYSATFCIDWILDPYEAGIHRLDGDRANGFSIRCLKD